MPGDSLPQRGRHWKWTVCGLLLLATTINYMDRLTLNTLAKRMMTDLDMDAQQYGRVESAFGIAFAVGGLTMGLLADQVNVRWLYPAAVLLWSAAGFLTGFAQGFLSLLWCRALLGFAEAGNWPCALKTTQHILPREERTLGNSILQSGASVGAIITPLICIGLVAWTGTWQYAFWVIGAVGVFWVGAWLTLVRSEDLARPPPEAPAPGAAVRRGPSAVQLRRFLVLVVLVVAINVSWHFFRVWLPLFLQDQHDYSERETGFFLSAYYVATDLGALASGFGALYLARRGLSVHSSRLLVFLVCALLAALSVVAAGQPRGPLLLALLLLIGFGALGLFPCFYSFSQELTTRHQGKVTGMLSFSCWTAMAVLHEAVGTHVKETGDYQRGVALAGLAPLAGFVVLLLFWGRAGPEGE